MTRILKVEGFPDLRKKEIFLRCGKEYSRYLPFIQNFLSSIENLFSGYWSVKKSWNKQKHLELKKLESSEKVDETAWILLPGDVDGLVKTLALRPITYIQLEEGAGVHIHYRVLGGVSKIYWVQRGFFSKDKFYLTPRQPKLESL